MNITRSSFFAIYVKLFSIALAVVLGFIVVVETLVAPKLVRDRAEAVQSLLRSHEADVLLNKTRSIRDELLKIGAITKDQDFSHHFYDESKIVKKAFNQCNFISTQICLGKNQSVFLVPNSNRAPSDDFKIAYIITSSLIQIPLALRISELIAALLIISAFLLVYKAISEKERYLTQRLDNAIGTIKRAREVFQEVDSRDEYDFLERSTEELVNELNEYKAKFERKTRLEQLGLTVAQVSHDLKAPLNEADNFLSSLPLLLKTASPEQLDEALASLIQRIRNAKEALTKALQFTKQLNIAKEQVPIGEILESLRTRVSDNPKLQKLTLNLCVTSEFITLGDRYKLETAFVNLLENTAEERFDANVNIALGKGELGHAKVTYLDDGDGIPDEHLDKIFEPLVTFKALGTGIGLSSTKEILTQHGGNIKAIPCKAGAKFEIQLPAFGGPHA